MLFAQLESGIALKPEEIDLVREIRELVTAQESQAAKKSLGIEISGNSSLPVITDRHLTGRALANILDNAVKFTNQGVIRITLKYSDPAGSMAEISVSDTGIGISPEKHTIIFEEFRQAEEGYNRPYEGSGLGLAIARKCTGLLGGTITVTSELGKGSTFTISIPSNKAAATVSQDKAKEPASQGHVAAGAGLPSVLLVEDNDSNIELVKIYLKNEYHLDIAKDGETSLEMARGKKYDVILMDINLGPGMDGIDAITEIRKMENHSHTPIIAVTGYTFRNEKDFIISKGADFYLEKPFLKKTLEDLLVQVTEKRAVIYE